jgi:hypothetical protein
MMPKVSQEQVEILTSEQIRAARAALGLTTRMIAESTAIGLATLKRYEATSGVPKSRKGHLAQLKAYFEAHGIQFVGTPDDDPGIRVTTPRPGA